MARAGLAVPVVFGGNDRFYPPVLAARDEAVAQRRGLFSPDVACTVPGRLQAVSTAVTQAPTAAAQPTNASSTQLDTAAAAAATVVAAATALESAFAGNRIGHVWAVFTPDQRTRLAQQVTGLRQQAQREATALRNAALTAQAAEVAAKRAAEDERQAREAQARRREPRSPRSRRPASLPPSQSQGQIPHLIPDRVRIPTRATPARAATRPAARHGSRAERVLNGRSRMGAAIKIKPSPGHETAKIMPSPCRETSAMGDDRDKY